MRWPNCKRAGVRSRGPGSSPSLGHCDVGLGQSTLLIVCDIVEQMLVSLVKVKCKPNLSIKLT